MVRATIACAWCRRAKIKCIHDGEPPCRNCLKSNRAECVLSGPFEQGQTSNATKRGGSAISASLHGRSVIRQNLEFGTANPRHSDETGVQKTAKEAILGIPPRILLEIATIFNRKFPELAFLHLPTFSSRRKEESLMMWIRDAAMLALCHRFLPVSTKNELSSEDELTRCVRENLQSVQNTPPSISAIQALLIMSMFEWGAGNAYAAWMYSGTATRTMQFLDAMKSERANNNTDSEIYNRTYWACFVMDRFIYCGKSQPHALPVEKMTIEFPIGEEDFTFSMTSDAGRFSEVTSFTVDAYYTVLTRGFEIWSKILDLIISGGRRKPGMSKSENCPWMPGSPWKMLLDSVEEWRSQQSDRLKFPTTGFAAHVSLGNGEKFAYVNLLYYVCILFLNREYIPFLPIQFSDPVGPIDPPLLEATAPPGWWQDRAKDLFNAAECITLIHQQLDLLNAPLFTPFAAFCSFCAGSMNGYVTAFPHMNLNRSPKSAVYEELDLLHLDKFTKLWKLGTCWVQTLKRVQNLHLCVIRDRSRFIGKTMSDFVALNESIQDYAGVTPSARGSSEPSEMVLAPPPIAKISPNLTSVVNPRGTLATQVSPGSAFIAPELNTEINLTGDEIWDQVWPIWGDQQFLSFEDGEMQFNYDPDLPSF